MRIFLLVRNRNVMTTAPIQAPILSSAANEVAENSGLGSVTSPQVERTQRIHYLDNLRALAMLLGVFLHAGLAYANPSQMFWLATDSRSSILLDISIWVVHLFRMSLFFLISGYFAHLLIQRRGVQRFLWNRTVRIVFPFLIFYPFLLVAMFVVIVFSLRYQSQPLGLMGLIANAAELDPKGASTPPLTAMHLWFLYYLAMFSLLAALFSKFRWLRFEGLFNRPWVVALTPLTLIPAIASSGIPMPAPESFIPQWWPFAYYGLFYWMGWQLYQRETLLDRLQPFGCCIAVICVVLYVPYYYWMPTVDVTALARGQLSSIEPTILFWESLLTAYLSVLLVVLCLVLGKKYLSHSNSRLRFLSDASYWIYLVHLPVVIFLQTLLCAVAMSVWIKLSIVILLTFLFCIATYIVFVRYTPVGWLLNGKREFP